MEDNSVVRDREPGSWPEGSLQQLQSLQNDPDHKDATRNSARNGKC